MDIQREIADQYQGLFNLMSKEHNIILTISEMDEIIIEAQKTVNKNFTNGFGLGEVAEHKTSLEL